MSNSVPTSPRAERWAAPKPAGAGGATPLALMASEPAPAGSAPRDALPSWDRLTYPSVEGLA